MHNELEYVLRPENKPHGLSLFSHKEMNNAMTRITSCLCMTSDTAIMKSLTQLTALP